MPVDLSQKGNTIRVTVSADGESILANHASGIDALESQREAGLKDRESGDGKSQSKTALTIEQKASVNASIDAQIVSEKRNLQIRLLDLCRSELSKSIDAASFSDADISTEKTERKAKVDAELDAVVASKPTVDVDAIKG